MEVIINGVTISGDEKEIRKALRQAKKEEKARQEENDRKREDARQRCYDRYVYICQTMDTGRKDGINWNFPRGWKLSNPNPPKNPTSNRTGNYNEFRLDGCHGSGDHYFWKSESVKVLEYGSGEPCALRVVFRCDNEDAKEDKIQWFSCGVGDEIVSTYRLPSFVESVLESHDFNAREES